MPSPRELVGTSMGGTNTRIRTDDDGMLFLKDFLAGALASGKLFYIFDKLSLGVGGRKFLLRVGANPVDVWWNVSAGVSTDVDLTEAPTISATGSSITVRNFNRDSVATLGLTAFLNPTSSAGTVIFSGQAGFGSGLAPVSGDIMSSLPDRRIAWRLKPSTDYVLSYSPVATIMTVMNAVFCEVTP